MEKTSKLFLNDDDAARDLNLLGFEKKMSHSTIMCAESNALEDSIHRRIEEIIIV